MAGLLKLFGIDIENEGVIIDDPDLFDENGDVAEDLFADIDDEEDAHLAPEGGDLRLVKQDDNSDEEDYYREGADLEDLEGNTELYSDSDESDLDYESERYAYSDSEEAEDSESYDAYDVYNKDPPYEYKLLEFGLYLLREYGSTTKFVVLAHENHPLVHFTRALVHNERLALRSALGQGAESFESLGNDGRIPGVLTKFVVSKLHRAPKFVFESATTGETHTIDEMPDDEVVPERLENIDIESGGEDPESELFVLEPQDFDYEERYKTLVAIVSESRSARDLGRFETLHNHGNLREFTKTGHTGPSVQSQDPQFTPVSPKDEHNGPWYCVKMHYYAMYRARCQMYEESHSLMTHTIRLRERAEESGDTAFALGVPPAGEYTAKQERIVLDRLFEQGRKVEADNHTIETKQGELVRTAAHIVQKITALRNIRLPESKSTLPLIGNDPNAVVKELVDDMSALRKALEDLNLAKRAAIPGLEPE